MGRGVGIPKLYVKFRWPLFLAMKFTFLFLNLGKIQILIPKSIEGGGQVRRFRNHSQTKQFFIASLINNFVFFIEKR